MRSMFVTPCPNASGRVFLLIPEEKMKAVQPTDHFTPLYAQIFPLKAVNVDHYIQKVLVRVRER
jgi:hypothetical protein